MAKVSDYEPNPYMVEPITSPEQDAEIEVLLDAPQAEMGGIEDMPDAELASKEPRDFYENLAERLDEETLEKVGTELVEAVKSDKQTLSDWEKIYVDGMKLLGFDIKNVREEVFPDSCTAAHPVLAESIVKYQAKARSQILRPDATARTKILGKATPQKRAQAERVVNFLNYQIQDQMPEYGPEHDRMLFYQAFGGSAFTKMYHDAVLNRPVTRCIKPMDFIIDYHATDLESAYRYTEVIKIHINDLRRAKLDGLYRDIEITPSEIMKSGGSDVKSEEDRLLGRSQSTEAEIVELYEVHTYYALTGDVDDRAPAEQEMELELPYIITIEASTGKVLSIRRNWKPDDTRYKKRVWYTHWVFIPGFGFHGFGYIHLIGGLSKAATSAMRQLIDAGSFATLPGGFKVHGLRVLGNNEPISPGEWRDVQAPGMDLAKALHPLPYKEPSQTLMALLEFLVMAAQKFADSTEQVVSESTNYGPVGTTLALLEASGRLFTGIHERLFESQKRELAILVEINAETLPDQYPFEMAGGQGIVARTDFDARLDVIPVTDPREPTAAHRAARANATLSIASQFPDQHNMQNVLQDLHAAIGTDDPERYLKQMQQPVSTDPVTENQLLLVGQAVKSAPEQEHMAHIQVHLLLTENPLYAQNPNVVAATMAHVQGHLADYFRIQMAQMGVPLGQPGAQVPPEVENRIALMAAKATEKMKANGITPVGPEEALDRAKLTLEAAELKLKVTETKRKEKLERDKMKMEDAHFKAELALEKRKIAVDAGINMIKARAQARNRSTNKGK